MRGEGEPNAASAGELARISQEVTERFYNLSPVSVRSDTLRARARALYGVLVVGEEMKGLVNCNFLPGSARRLELGTVSAEPLSRAYWSQNSGRSAKRLACRARVLLAKVPIVLKRAVGLSGPSSSRQSAPILQQWSEQVCRSFEAGQAMKP